MRSDSSLLERASIGIRLSVLRATRDIDIIMFMDYNFATE